MERLVIDLQPDGRAAVASGAAERFELSWPLEDRDTDELRWYLEDYLRVPYGVYADRGRVVADALEQWGNDVFGALLGPAPAGRAYRALGPGAEIVCRSSAADLLALPWELLWDPARAAPVAIEAGALTRSIPGGDLEAELIVGGERLRVLMVISRPSGTDDVGYRMIARPLLDRLRAVRGRVELSVLRPPTHDALAQTLAGAEPYHIVHFDAHGVLAGGEGLLAFEQPGGGRDLVRVSGLGELLAGAGVPLVVLNACQSGAVGKQLEAAAATSLLQAGIPSVVAMAYNIYAVAAAEFMAAFYDRIFAGVAVAEAVTAGRRRLYERNERPSPKGMMPLADWLVPAHYARRAVRFPQLHGTPPAAPHRPRELEPEEAFVGRDALFYELELAARKHQVVLLHGPAGTGKTELAKAFGRWWEETGGVDHPAGVIVSSFEPGIASFGLDGVLSEIGLRLLGVDFGRLDPAGRRSAVERLLAEHRLLLIWDNFETAHSLPDRTGATEPLDDAARAELQGFVQSLRARGSSSLLITSRSDEGWLGPLTRVEVGGLTADEAIEYAELLVGDRPAASARRATRAYGELLVDRGPSADHADRASAARRRGAAGPARRVARWRRRAARRARRWPDVLARPSRARREPQAAGPLPVPRGHRRRRARRHGAGGRRSRTPGPARSTRRRAPGWSRSLSAAACTGCTRRCLGCSPGAGGPKRVRTSTPSTRARCARSRRPTPRSPRSSSTRSTRGRSRLGPRLHRPPAAPWATSSALRSGSGAGATRRGCRGRSSRSTTLGGSSTRPPRGRAACSTHWEARPRALDGDDGEVWLQTVASRADRDRNALDLDGAAAGYKAILGAAGDEGTDHTKQYVGRAYLGLGTVERERARFAEAQVLYERAAALFEQLKHEHGLGVAYHDSDGSPRTAVTTTTPSASTRRRWRSTASLATRRTSPSTSTTWAGWRRSEATSTRPRTSTSRASRSRSASATCPSSPGRTTTSGWSPTTAVCSTRPRTGTAGRWSSRADRRPARRRHDVPPARHARWRPAATGRRRGVAPGGARLRKELGDTDAVAGTCRDLAALAHADGGLDAAQHWTNGRWPSTRSAATRRVSRWRGTISE